MTAAQSNRLLAAAALFVAGLSTVLITDHLAAEGTVSPIDWDAAKLEAQSPSSERLSALVKLSEADQDRIGLPVLLPNREDLAGKTLVAPLDDLYTATFKEGAATVSITGSKLISGTPSLPLGAPRGDRISRTDTGLDLSFSRFGAAYLISIECPNPDRDPQCASDDYATALKNSLAVVTPRDGGAAP